MRNKLVLIIAPFLFLTLFSCAAHVHTVGNGPSTGETVTATQWYALNGLYPLNEVDTSAMAGGATDYEITTSMEPIDIVIGGFTGMITVNRRTVTVTK